MTHLKRFLVMSMSSLAITATVSARQATTATTPAGHSQHIDAKGKQVMGFDQHKTTHHFRLYEDGGAIDVSVKDKTDKANLDAFLKFQIADHKTGDKATPGKRAKR